MTASPFQRVVAGYDGSSSGDDALALAVLLAGESGQLVAARVFSSRRGGAQPPEVAELQGVAGGLGAGAEAPVARSAAAGLHDLAAEIDADLLVVGSAEPGAARPIAGSTGERLLHGSPCAVALAPAGFREREQRLRVIGVGYDGSPEADVALDDAIGLAESNEATMRIFTVDPPVPALEAGGEGPSTHDRYEAASRIAQERAPGSVRAATAVVRGTPAAVLRQEAEKGIDLLAIGSRGFGPVRRTFSGGVASALIHDLPCPLLVFPRGAEEPGPMERVEIDPAERHERRSAGSPRA